MEIQYLKVKVNKVLTNQIEEVPADLSNHARKRGSEQLLNAGGPVPVHGVCLNIINPLKHNNKCKMTHKWYIKTRSHFIT